MTEVHQPVDYKDTVINALTIVAPPVAIVVRRGKSELDSRHLVLSFALYCSFIFYLPSVLHAFWLLHIRDQGGFKHWGEERVKDVMGIWAKYEPYIAERVQPYWKPVSAATERWHVLAKEWQQLIVANYVQVAALFRTITERTVELVNDAWVAYTHGHMFTWIAHNIHVLLEKLAAATKQWYTLARDCQQWIMAKYALAKSRSYLRVKALILYIEQRLLTIITFVTQTLQFIKEKIAYTISHLSFSPAESMEIVRETQTTVSAHNSIPEVECFG